MTEAPLAEGQDSGAPESGGTQGEGREAQRTFSQADLNKIAANEKRSGTKAGREAAITELLEKTGAESLDDVLSAYTEYQGIQEAVTTEADRERTAREKAEEKSKTFQERYTSTVREYALRDALRDAGINSDRLALAVKVADLSEIQVDKDGKLLSGVDEAVQAIQEASPEWFGSQERPRVNAPQTEGTGVERPGEGSGDPRTDMGSALLGFLQTTKDRKQSLFEP